MNTVLIISPEPWSAHTVSKHHYAMTLAERGAKVFFLNPPDDSLSGLSISPVEKFPNLNIVSAPKIIPGLRFCPAFIRRRLESRWLAILEKTINTRISAVWLFENSRFFDMRFAGSRLKIYHQVDLNQNFNLSKAASTADACFCTTDFIEARLLPHNPRVYKIHHGFSVPAKMISLPIDQSHHFNTITPNAVYIGNMNLSYIDADLLACVAEQFNQVQFHFVGDYSNNLSLRKRTSNLPNVMWWGRVESNLIPAILDRAQILLVAYKAKQFREQLASPHKMLEYLASGKTIVSTYTDEYKDKRHLLEMVDNTNDYISALEHVVKNLDNYNSEEKQYQRIDFALNHSYDKQLDVIFDLLEQNGLVL